MGPTFGEQIARTAIIAVIASLLLISLYIGFRFEFKFAVPVLIALAHDILITAGVYALTDREVTTSTVAALLTILGYSLYDTVIVFDRIRENVPRMPRATFSQIANRSMSEVFTRSLATSFVVLMPVGSLMLFGGETLRDFAFALLVGVASGAYSSIFIATPGAGGMEGARARVHAPAQARHGGPRRRGAGVRHLEPRRRRGRGDRRRPVTPRARRTARRARRTGAGAAPPPPSGTPTGAGAAVATPPRPSPRSRRTSRRWTRRRRSRRHRPRPRASGPREEPPEQDEPDERPSAGRGSVDGAGNGDSGPSGPR